MYRKSQILGRTPRDVILAIKKLSTLLEKRNLTTGVIFGSVITRPQNISFLRSISDSMEFKPESLSRSELGAQLGTKEMSDKPLLTAFAFDQLASY